MTFSLHQGGIVMSSQITHTQLSNIHSLAHILDICSLMFNSCVLFSLFQRHHVTASHPCPSDHHQRWEGSPKDHSSKQKWASTRTLHSLQFFTHCYAASTIIPLLPKAIFTPSIQPNMGLPCTCIRLTSPVNTLLVIWH